MNYTIEELQRFLDYDVPGNKNFERALIQDLLAAHRAINFYRSAIAEAADDLKEIRRGIKESSAALDSVVES